VIQIIFNSEWIEQYFLRLRRIKMTNDLVKRLRADELPEDSQNKREARMELGKILDEAADRIEKLEAALRRLLLMTSFSMMPALH
jgi:hypothetical protein